MSKTTEDTADVAALRAEVEALRKAYEESASAAAKVGGRKSKGGSANEAEREAIAAAKKQAQEDRKASQQAQRERLAVQRAAAASQRAEDRKAASVRVSAATAAAKIAVTDRDKPVKVAEAGNTSAKYLAKQAGIGKAALRAPVLAASLDLTKLALGLKGMAQLGAVEQRAAFNARQLFLRVDSSPVVKAADRVAQIVNKSSVTGHALEGIFTRAFNSIFGKAAGLGDLLHTVFQGGVLAALKLEAAYLDVSYAVYPFTSAVEAAIGPADRMNAAAAVGAIALVGLGAAAATAAIPVLSIAAAFEAVSRAIGQASALYKQWDNNSFGQIKNQLKQDLGLESAKEAQDRILAKAGATQAYVSAPPTESFLAGQSFGATEPAKKGQADGKAFADGVVKGVADGTPGVVAAGQGLARALDQGTRQAGQIHSPSELTRATGRMFPAGTAKGIDDGAPMVEAAAARSMVPGASSGQAGAGVGASGGGGVSIRIEVVNHWPNAVATSQRGTIAAEVENGINAALRAVNQHFGIPVMVTR